MRFLIVLALFTACPHPQPKPTPPPGSECMEMCDHLRALGCKTAEPTPEGTTCEQVCRNTQESGIIKIDLKCMTAAPNCDGADSCGAPGQGVPPPAFGAGSGGATRH